MITLALLNSEHNSRLWEESGLIPEISSRVKPQGPARGTLYRLKDIDESVYRDLAGGGRRRVGQPDANATIVISDGLESLGSWGGR